MEEFEKLRNLLSTLSKASSDEQIAVCQEFLTSLRTFQEAQVCCGPCGKHALRVRDLTLPLIPNAWQTTLRTQMLESVVQLYRQVSPVHTHMFLIIVLCADLIAIPVLPGTPLGITTRILWRLRQVAWIL